jgi:guanylate kinase
VDYSVSCTTRPPRPSEVDGRDYRFVSEGEFSRLIEDGAFLEWAEVFGHRYGTLWGPIDASLAAGRSVLLEIDIVGASWVRRRRPDAMLMFLEPPSLEELARRLRARATEDEARIRARLERAAGEMAEAHWFDVRVVNDDVERAGQEIAGIIDATSGP